VVVHVPGPDHQPTYEEARPMAAHDSIPEIRDVPGFPGYGVSADGRVWTRLMLVSRGKGNGTGKRTVLGNDWRELRHGIAFTEKDASTR
jgi:hypothetical protein